MKKDFAIYSIKMANALAKQGFELVGTGTNIKNNRYTVFYFKDTPKLREAIDSFLKGKL